MSLDVFITIICKLWGHCGGAHHERSCGCLKGNVQLSLSCAHEVWKCESPDDDCWNPSRLRQGGIWCVTNQSSEQQGSSWTNSYFLAICVILFSWLGTCTAGKFWSVALFPKAHFPSSLKKLWTCNWLITWNHGLSGCSPCVSLAIGLLVLSYISTFFCGADFVAPFFFFHWFLPYGLTGFLLQGYGFVQFSSKKSALKAQKEENGKLVCILSPNTSLPFMAI